MNRFALVMAAGEGQRMQSDMPKMLHPICGKPIIGHVLDTVRAVCGEAMPILGHGREEMLAALGDIPHAVQDFSTGKGTGHAVLCASAFLEGVKGGVIVTAGDMPLVTAESYHALLRAVEEGASAALLYDTLEDPFGYGRVIFSAQGHAVKIVEQKDLTEQEALSRACNGSVYCFNAEALRWALPRIENHNAAGEYYLTDCISVLAEAGHVIRAVHALDHDECRGINTRVQLHEAAEAMRGRINRAHMLSGVTMIDPKSTYIDVDVTIGRDTVLYPGVVLERGTSIGTRCTLLGATRMAGAKIGDGVRIESSVLTDCEVGSGTTVGPFAYIRPGTRVGQKCRVGDFVELKNSSIGDLTHISHLTYVGDSDLGEDINLGCGVVFSNYDGKVKHRSKVGDRAFIGCNVNLVSPVTVGEGAYIAAGSTVTEDVPPDALAVARTRQVNKPDWAKKRREAGKL